MRGDHCRRGVSADLLEPLEVVSALLGLEVCISNRERSIQEVEGVVLSRYVECSVTSQSLRHFEDMTVCPAESVTCSANDACHQYLRLIHGDSDLVKEASGFL